MESAQERSTESTRTVLVVDDDERLREMLRMGLEAMGFTIHVACNGEEALSLLGEWHYDAVICDLEMPNMCGDELFRRCRHQHPETARRFIFLSGSPKELMPPDLADTAEQPWLTKPCRLADLQAAIVRVAL